MIFLAKFFNNKDSINWAVSNFGTTCFVTHSIKKEDLDLMMKELSLHVGGLFDYSFCGGRVAIKYLGSHKQLKERYDYLQFIHNKYYIKHLEETNKTTTVIGLDGKPCPFYSEKAIQDSINGVWEYNEMYRN